MQLNSFAFFVFFVAVLAVYWKIHAKYQWVFLLLASYYYFASWKPAYAGIILLTTIINYFSGIIIDRSKRHKKSYLFLALIFNLGALLTFKYLQFFTLTLNDVFKVFNWQFQLPQFKLLLPIGISFYTLQVIGYLLDVYWGKIKPEKHFGFFALFLCFFPQLAAGPIERAKHLFPQLKKQHIFDSNEVVSGAKLFTCGLFKKLIIADNLGMIVDRVFTTLPEYKGLSMTLAVFFYTWQIYADFSGYTDMARGTARMAGVDLLENFHFPYLATSVQDFWRRWHISLSSWFKDYVYIPLGGNRYGLPKMILSTLIVFTLSGLWHGAAWHFVVWGILHGIWISGERLIKKVFGKKSLLIPYVLKVAYTYCVISVFWVFFRANTITDALYVLQNASIGIKNFIFPSYVWASLNQLFIFNIPEMLIVFGALGIAVLLEVFRGNTSLSQVFSRQPVFIRFIFYSVVIFLIIELRSSQMKEFIYTRF